MSKSRISYLLTAAFAFVVLGFYLSTPHGAASLGLSYRGSKAASQEAVCVQNLRALGQAMLMYAEQHDSRFPPAASQVATVQPTQTSGCPTVHRSGRTGYAANLAIASKTVGTGRVPLVFDADLRCSAFYGDLDCLPEPGRHNGKNNVLLVDGSLRSSDAFDIRIDKGSTFVADSLDTGIMRVIVANNKDVIYLPRGGLVTLSNLP